MNEQRILTISIGATVVGAIAGIVFGLISGSRSITFDGFYELTDAAMTGLALLVAKLIARGTDRRFQYGYWHLEPLMVLVNGMVLATACAYAFFDAINILLSGGRIVKFGVGSVYLFLTGLLSLGMLIITRKAARSTGSKLVEADARAWLIGTLLSAGLLVSFISAALAQKTSLADYSPYLDPAILALVSLLLLPLPLRMAWTSAKELLLVAPADLNEKVTTVVKAVGARHGFDDCRTYLMRTGRQQFLDVTMIAADPAETRSFAELDAIREEIIEALGDSGATYWLSVDFTADERWQ